MSTKLATPGVYLVERDAFGKSVVAVPTAVPAFIGYTAKASKGSVSLLNKPTRVDSFSDFIRYFGGAPRATFSIKSNKERGYDLNLDKTSRYLMYDSIRLFYANGGGSCYIVSVGDYSGGVKAKDLNDEKTGGGLQTLYREQEPTMVVVPDAVLLSKEDCYSLYQGVLMHCGSMQNRMAILDVYDGDQTRDGKEDVIESFREGVGNNHLAFGAGYYPWLNTTIVGSSELSYRNISNSKALVSVLTAEVEARFLGSDSSSSSASSSSSSGSSGSSSSSSSSASKTPPKKPAPATADPKMVRKFEAAKAEIERLEDDSADFNVVHENLVAISPRYRRILQDMRRELNLLPPSAAMAGVYALTDRLAGVHKAPANVSLNSVISPAINLTSEDQEDLNSPISGKSVNAIRTFVNKGTLVWGARTLNGNSQDWRYINVRRTMNMIEQSIKNAIEAYVFEPNTPGTWIRVKAAITSFLNSVWLGGSLMGASPGEAYSVAIGLGETMTPTDILDGIMRVDVKVAITRPAEFIVITFEQMIGGPAGGEEEEEGGDEGGGEEGGGE
jgi:phage tail sheath protein FI